MPTAAHPLDLLNGHHPADPSSPLSIPVYGAAPACPAEPARSEETLAFPVQPLPEPTGKLPEAAPEETPLDRLIEEIGRYRPAQAQHLRHLRREAEQAAECTLAARTDAAVENAHWNERAEATNRSLETEQQSLRSAAETAARPHVLAAEQLQPELDQAHESARVKSGVVGRAYDPGSPTVEPLLVVPPPSPAAVAARASLPDPENDHGLLLNAWLAWSMTLLVGAGIGVSLALAAHLLEPDTLSRHLGLVALSALAGVAIAAFCRKAIALCARHAGELGALGRPPAERVPWVVGTFVIGGAVLLLDLLVEREGLLRLGRLSARVGTLSGHSAGGPETSWVWWLIPAILTLGYVIYAALEGFLAGRVRPLRQRLAQAQEDALRSAQERWRARADVGEALAAVAAAAKVHERLAAHLEAKAVAEAPFNCRIAKLEAERRPVRPGPTPEQQRRITGAEAAAHAAETALRAAVSREMAHLDPGR